MNDDRSFDRINNTDFEQIPGLVRSDKHREAVIKVIGQDWIVECMEYVMVLKAVFSRAVCDQRLIHYCKLPCRKEFDNELCLHSAGRFI